MTNNLKQIDALIKKNLRGVATKKDIVSVETRLVSVETRLRKEMATKQNLVSLESRLRKEMATKQNLTSLESRLSKKIKEDIDEAVIQVISAVDKTITPLVRRMERVEEHLELPTLG